MKQGDFWRQLEERMEENKRLQERGGMSSRLAVILAPVGLEFWKVGMAISLLAAVVIYGLFSKEILVICKSILIL